MNKIVGGLIVVSLVFVAGFLSAKKYYSQNSTEVTKDDHTKTTIVKIVQPDGTVKEVTTIDSITKTTEKTKSVTPPKTNISLLVGNDFSKREVKPLYGVSVITEVLGPVTIGAQVYTGGIIGVSIGYNF